MDLSLYRADATTQLNVRVSRSDWIRDVLTPTAYGDYVINEIRVPRGSVATQWRSAAERLQDADELLVLGRHAEALFQCRAALETLPGSPKRIFDFVEDEAKRTTIDELTRQLVRFLHLGRHVKTGEGFAVDHRDAQFAVYVTKTLLSYASTL